MILNKLEKFSDEELDSWIFVRGFRVFHVLELNDQKIGARRGLIRHMNFKMGKQLPEIHYVRKDNNVEVVNDPSEKMLHIMMDFVDMSRVRIVSHADNLEN